MKTNSDQNGILVRRKRKFNSIERLRGEKIIFDHSKKNSKTLNANHG